MVKLKYDKTKSWITCLAKYQERLPTNYQFLMKKRQQTILSQTIDKTMAKPVGMVKTKRNPKFVTRQRIAESMFLTWIKK